MTRFVAPAAIVAATLFGWGALSPDAPAAERTSTGTGLSEDYGGLPEGPGREAVFYTCSACHSIRLVVQQRLSRDVWDETLDYMVKEQTMPEMAPDERTVILDYLSTYLSATTP